MAFYATARCFDNEPGSKLWSPVARLNVLPPWPPDGLPTARNPPAEVFKLWSRTTLPSRLILDFMAVGVGSYYTIVDLIVVAGRGVQSDGTVERPRRPAQFPSTPFFI